MATRSLSTWQRCKRYLRRMLFWSFMAIVVLSLLLVLPWRWIDPPTSAFMLGELLRTGDSPDYRWTPYDRMAPCMGIAAVAAEDQKFPDHHGFDLQSIADALEESPETRRGASTISQQTAKNLFLWGGRSYLRKGLEAWLTLFIETLWSKRRILEVYLNLAEFGPGIYGVGAAGPALRNRTPPEFSDRDCSLLAAVLPSPRRLSAAQPSDYVNRRAATIREQMARLGGPAYLDQL